MKTKRMSGVSVAIRSALESKSVAPHYLKDFRIKVVQTEQERDSVFRLGYKTYFEKGFVKKNRSEKLICDYDFENQTVILMVTDRENKLAGTLTLVCSDYKKLPAYVIYKDELQSKGSSGEKIAELCRFAIDPSFRNSREILYLLFNYAAIFLYTIKKVDGLVIEVTPRHSLFYKEFLGFEVLGAPKCCPQVENTVGVLLYLSSMSYRKICSESNSVYSYFNSNEKELIASYLKSQIMRRENFSRPLPLLSESGFNQAVCI